MRLPASGNGVRRARGLADVVGGGVPQERRDDLRLLLSEVTTNAIRHGGPVEDATEAEVRVRLGVHGRRVRVEVHDRGPGFEHVPRGPQARLDSGWGVHFVHTLADEWGARRGGDGAWVVWFELDLILPDGPGSGLEYGQSAADGAPLEDPHPVRRSVNPTELAGTG